MSCTRRRKKLRRRVQCETTENSDNWRGESPRWRSSTRNAASAWRYLLSRSISTKSVRFSILEIIRKKLMIGRKVRNSHFVRNCQRLTSNVRGKRGNGLRRLVLKLVDHEFACVLANFMLNRAEIWLELVEIRKLHFHTPFRLHLSIEAKGSQRRRRPLEPRRT